MRTHSHPKGSPAVYKQATILQRAFLGAPQTHRATIEAAEGEHLSVLSGTDYAGYRVIDLRRGGDRRTDDPEWTMRVLNPKVDFLGPTQIKISGVAAPMAEDGTSEENTAVQMTDVILNLR